MIHTEDNPCPDGYRTVRHGERIADPHMMLGRVIGALRADGVDIDLDRDMTDVVAAMTEVLRVLGVASAPEMKYEAHVVAG